MKRYHQLYTDIANTLTVHRYEYFGISILFFIGILTGSIFAATSDNYFKIRDSFAIFWSAYPMQSAAHSDILQSSLLHYLQLAVLLWLSGWSGWLLPVGVIQIIAKSFRTGYVVACLLRAYSLRGMAIALLSLLPQNLILIPALCFDGVYQISFFKERRYIAGNPGQHTLKRQIYRRNAKVTLLFLLLLFFCAWLESYVVPVLLHAICGIV